MSRHYCNSPPQLGWIGTQGELDYVLSQSGAETDADGRYRLSGEPPANFLGMDGPMAEVVVSARCFCRVNGRDVSVAYLLGQTSYGLKIHVV